MCVCVIQCSIVCPDEDVSETVTFWAIMTKVRLEAIMWVSLGIILLKDDTCTYILASRVQVLL